MRKKDVTKEQFAIWSFERDLEECVFEDEPDIRRWEDLGSGDKQLYLNEAEEYISGSLQDNWPIDILERLEE